MKYVFLIYVFIFACAKVSVADEAPKPLVLEQVVQFSVTPQSEPERYTVKFSWPFLEAERFIKIASAQPTAELFFGEKEFIQSVNHDQVLNYQFEVYDNTSTKIESFTKQVQVPKDFVVRDGQNVFSTDVSFQVNRFFFKAPLLTNGKKLTIETNELIAAGGVIESFGAGRKEAPTQVGFNGGDVMITAQKASGDLRIYLRGTSGGDGVNGGSLPRAPNGLPGGPGTWDCPVPASFPSPMLSQLSSVINHEPGGSHRCTCGSRGRGGTPGAAGAKGISGTPGGSGGHGGNVQVAITEGNQFYVTAESTPGIGGNGGIGGPGQLGGIGGAAGGTAPNCDGGAGPNGPNGPTGDNGPHGANGIKGTVCISISSRNFAECVRP